MSNSKMLAVIGLAFLFVVMLMGSAVRSRWTVALDRLISIDDLRP